MELAQRRKQQSQDWKSSHLSPEAPYLSPRGDCVAGASVESLPGADRLCLFGDLARGALVSLMVIRRLGHLGQRPLAQSGPAGAWTQQELGCLRIYFPSPPLPSLCALKGCLGDFHTPYKKSH